ncbi:DNA-directed RNA polymerase I and III subunit [Penicillium subrubescens]|uniref:DNA-directed RNA polymerases I and III subunit RPAC2 n=1 Tax=Penicillium subrubescens TaxID=1316194 RepID=A0A1Q5TE02_9EURO|nr:DNA-directed RNA polymerase I and III subunit [Penicillium subrubescens]KAJ5873473.1 DNA-directed RNA polymerase I and III subunit [Penicillium subrubescens]OKO98443.1 DNA-directed RNA polymerases I and III subunit RPAC2 [Penicillium subrubescens]
MPASVHSEDAQEHDQSMMDVEAEEPVNPILLDEKRIVVLPGSTETSASFQFDGEGHTMGNALRYSIMKNPAVEFCGYTIPHPSDAKMHVRIQTNDTTTALEALEKGFNDLMDLCDVVTEKFTAARDQFKEDQVNRMEG